MDLGRSLFAAVFPEFIAREELGPRGRDVKEEAQGVVRPAAEGEDTALRALTARHRGPRSREKAMKEGKDDQRPKDQGDALRPTPRAERPRVPQARLIKNR